MSEPVVPAAPALSRAYLALGSNLGDRAGFLAYARQRVASLPATAVVASSPVEETAPLGGRDQPPYLNQMLLVTTGLSPRDLLGHLLGIERDAGRVRGTRWDSRTLDIDIVRYGDLELTAPDLMLPHPGLADRHFWQREIADIEAQLEPGE